MAVGIFLILGGFSIFGVTFLETEQKIRKVEKVLGKFRDFSNS